ncbi:hypothetical protein [Bacteriovorax sp. Seq25_V]|uniref:hypothetical protein n=1 Tax=Bacteriovorax sp. Seq25_V TaxID=1201288 RepID=UPI00038A2314|nr:hypothetical protein [Bacteriovorax sp. Seq25_V]EQC47094.1 hypothetical protein M900_0526 [Bacteriovorax sp. Seq25_V]
MTNFKHEKSIGRLIILQAVCFLISSVAVAGEKNLFEAFNPNYKIKSRMPQSFTADVDFVAAPEKEDPWYAHIFVEDDSGVLNQMRANFANLEANDEYTRNWDMESTGLYSYSTQEQRVTYFNKYILKYVDKRISGEVKKAEEGSTLAAVGNVQKALKPQTDVNFAQNMKLKIRAKVLQGEVYMDFINPYVDSRTTLSLSGDINMNVKKEFKEYRGVASVDYNPKDGNYVTQFDKYITDALVARVSSSQDQSRSVFSEDSDARFQLMYARPFNY